MPGPLTSETARRRRSTWAFALAALAAIAGAPAQSAAVVQALPPETASRLAALTEDDDPVLRGEAALVLGTLGATSHETAIRRVAEDRNPRARQRGLIALARLAPPGAEVELGEALEELDPDDPVRHAAAYGLGVLPDDFPTPQIDAYAERHVGGNYRKERDTIAALLGGLATSPHPSRRRVCQNLLADAALRDDGVRALAVTMLARSDGIPSLEGLLHRLETDGPLERWALMDVAREYELSIGAEALDRVERLARRDADPRVRTAALRFLLHAERPALSSAAERALRSNHPDEAATAVAALLRLGGGPRRARVAERIVEVDDAGVRTAMLEAWRGELPEDLADHTRTVARDTRQDAGLRLAAARLLSRAEADAALPVLRELAERTSDVAVLTEVYRSLLALGHGDEVVRGVESAATDPESRPLLAARIRALITSRHPAAADLLGAVLAEEDLDSATRTEVVIAWRRAIDPEQSGLELAALPADLRAVLD